MSLLNTHAMGRALARRLLFLFALVLSAVVMGTLGYHLLEGWSLFDSLYMTVITLATIGYGETHPLDMVGRVFTVVLIIFGTGVMGYGISSLTLLLFQGDLPHYLRVRKMDKNHLPPGKPHHHLRPQPHRAVCAGRADTQRARRGDHRKKRSTDTAMARRQRTPLYRGRRYRR